MNPRAIQGLGGPGPDPRIAQRSAISRRPESLFKPELEESDCERRVMEWTSQGYTRTQAEHILEFSDREGIGQVG